MKKIYTLLSVFVLLLGACTGIKTESQPGPTKTVESTGEIANPASQYCLEQGGTLAIEEGGDGGQFGVCYFEDNHQCEEWAFMKGDCPAGGVKVTGYTTQAARYCAITGGEYAIIANGGAEDEQGTCTFKDGSQCDAVAYYNGECSPGVFPTIVGASIQPLSVEICNGQAQAMAHFLNVLEVTQSEAPLGDPASGAAGMGCLAKVIGNGAQFESPEAVVSTLGTMLVDQGWSEEEMYAAGGPTGAALGYRKDKQVCLATAIWEPDEAANCPADQPISECELTPEQKLYTVTLNCGEVPQEPAAPEAGLDQIVFDTNRGGAYRDLYIMNSDGYDMSRLTRGEGDSFAGPWSPDGQRIVFTTFGLTNSAIAVINADGSEQSILAAIDGSDEGFPDWSPDGGRIAFTSRRDGNNEIYLMNADGSDPQRLTNAPGDDFAPSWSPDGSQIAFVSDRDQESGVYDLYIMNADGSDVRRLTNDTAIDYSPDWSPDGKTIVFRSHHDGPADIFVINLDGSGIRNLTDNPAEDWAPTWSPDGKYIAFQTDRDGNWEIYRMNSDGSDPVNLTNDPADDQLPYW